MHFISERKSKAMNNMDEMNYKDKAIRCVKVT